MKLASMRKKGDVHSAIGIRFDVALADDARPAIERELSAAFASVTAWTAHPEAGRTYLRAVTRNAPACEELAARLGARVTSPPFVALDLRPHDPRDVARLAEALESRGAPAGIADAARHSGGLAVEFDSARASLACVLDAVDAALGAGRSIVALRPLEDATLAAFAAARLREPALNVSRIIETYVEELAGPASS